MSAYTHLAKSSEGTPDGPLGTPGLGEGRVGKLFYWMPGAEHDATGSVPQGLYRVEAELPERGRTVRLRLAREQVASVMADGSVASSCRNISPRLDTAVGLLEDALAAPGTSGTR